MDEETINILREIHAVQQELFSVCEMMLATGDARIVAAHEGLIRTSELLDAAQGIIG